MKLLLTIILFSFCVHALQLDARYIKVTCEMVIDNENQPINVKINVPAAKVDAMDVDSDAMDPDFHPEEIIDNGFIRSDAKQEVNFESCAWQEDKDRIKLTLIKDVEGNFCEDAQVISKDGKIEIILKKIK